MNTKIILELKESKLDLTVEDEEVNEDEDQIVQP